MASLSVWKQLPDLRCKHFIVPGALTRRLPALQLCGFRSKGAEVSSSRQIEPTELPQHSRFISVLLSSLNSLILGPPGRPHH